MRKIAIFAATATLLTACQQVGDSYDGNQNSYKGAALGAAIGAAIGSLTGDGSTQRRQRATVGAGAGALAGIAIGQYMDRQEDSLRDKLSGSGVEVKRQGDEILLNMPSSITFAVDRSDIQPQFYSAINDVASTLKQYPKTYITIAGHTDSTGKITYNQYLSERRAESVADYLRGQGIGYDRISTKGYGESQPIANNHTETGRAQNRRVEVRITPMQ